MPEPLPIHPFCDLFPDIEGEEFGQFVASIKANGLQTPIDEYKSQVVDGKNRQRACFLAGVQPVYKIWSPPKGTPPEKIDEALLAFIKSRNLDRRHFTVGQKSMMAAKLSQLPRGRPAAKATPEKPATVRQASVAPKMDHHKLAPSEPTKPVPAKQISKFAEIEQTPTKEAAKQFGVSERSVQAARRVQESATPEVAKAVQSGRMSLNAAVETIKSKPVDASDSNGKEIERGIGSLKGVYEKAEDLLAKLFNAVDDRKAEDSGFGMKRHPKFEKALRAMGEAVEAGQIQCGVLETLWNDTKEQGLA